MLSLFPSATRGRKVSRRQVLRMGMLAPLAGAFPSAVARAAAESATTGSAKRCIYIFLCGGPSQPDLWDMKPQAPEGIRSVFRPIATSVPGIHFGELVPCIARHADKLALIRSMTHHDNGHNSAIARSLLGQLPARPGEVHVSRDDHPGIGAILHAQRGDCGEMPPWMILPRRFTTYSPAYKGQSAGFLGSAYDPVAFDKAKIGSLTDAPLKLGAIELPEGVTQSRLRSRGELLGSLASEARWRGSRRELDAFRDQAFMLLSSSKANRAFDLDQESDVVRDRYGRNEYGQSFLMARRLVEAGVRMVNVFWTFFDAKGCQFNLWDNHGVATDVCGVDGQMTGVQQLTHKYCTPSFDLAFSALLEDLDQRGLLEETLVVVAGEFGRTPRINKTAGRDHWAPCYTQLLAGGGVRGGRTYGASDAVGAFVKDRPVTPDDFAATVLHAFGLSPRTEIHDSIDRPHRITTGSPVTDLF